MKKRHYGLTLLFFSLLILTMVGCTSNRASDEGSSTNTKADSGASNTTAAFSTDPQLITDHILAQPVTTDHFLFWIDRSNQKWSIYGYDLSKQSKFLVTDRPGNKSNLASDGKILAWAETNGQVDKIVSLSTPCTRSWGSLRTQLNSE